MTRTVTLIVTYDQDLTKPREIAETLAITEMQYDGVVRVTAICDHEVVTLNTDTIGNSPI